MISLYLSIVETEEDKKKVTFIYEKCYSFMYYMAKQYLGNDYDIEDVVHNSMLKIIENLDIIDTTDEKRVKNLCGVIAKNKAIDLIRSHKGKDNTGFNDEVINTQSEALNPSDIVMTQEVYNLVLEKIHSLDDTYRDVCMLKYVNELKEKEIALLLDLPPKTVSLRIFRGKQILREAIRKENLHE